MEEEKTAEELKLFLKKREPNGSSANVKIVIESDTFKKIETSYGKYDFNNRERGIGIYNKINGFDEEKNEFKIVVLEHPLGIPYENLKYWKFMDLEPNKDNPNEIRITLNKAVVLYERKKVELEEFDYVLAHLEKENIK